jgi:hypothetical protein
MGGRHSGGGAACTVPGTPAPPAAARAAESAAPQQAAVQPRMRHRRTWSTADSLADLALPISPGEAAARAVSEACKLLGLALRLWSYLGLGACRGAPSSGGRSSGSPNLAGAGTLVGLWPRHQSMTTRRSQPLLRCCALTHATHVACAAGWKWLLQLFRLCLYALLLLPGFLQVRSGARAVRSMPCASLAAGS